MSQKEMTMSEGLILDVGTANDIKMALRRAGYTPEEVTLLKSGDNLEQYLQVLRGEARIVPIPLLTSVTTVQVNAVERFVASEAFNPDDIRFYLWPNFRNYFLEKVEENVPTGEFAIQRLERSVKDDAILRELGDKAEVVLAHFYELIKRQPQGQEGDLLTDGRANIFYVRDAENMVWAVSAGWHSVSRKWYLNANPIDYPRSWCVGHHVISQVSSS
ncbi:MAG: hypothetical protein ABH833_03500 [Parcubacteria group bacterium]